MHVLIPGGTGFLGSACVRQALERGHQVTVLSRSGQNVPKGADVIIADRCAPLPPMDGRFDAVIDTKAYQPAMVDHITEALKDPVPYALASSISVYDRLEAPGADETAEASLASDAIITEAWALPPKDWCNLEKMGQHYGPLKRACEERLLVWAGDLASIHRLGLICGPGDKTDRFTWWLRTIDEGGPVPVPGPGDRSVQLIDVEDAAAFLLHCVETKQSGAFNVTGPAMELGDLLQAVLELSGSGADLNTVPEAAIETEGLKYWTDLPLIIPNDSPKRAMLDVSTDRAIAAGLVTRPVVETLTRALEYDRTDRDRPLIAGLSTDQRARLLAHSPSG